MRVFPLLLALRVALPAAAAPRVSHPRHLTPEIRAGLLGFGRWSATHRQRWASLGSYLAPGGEDERALRLAAPYGYAIDALYPTAGARGAFLKRLAAVEGSPEQNADLLREIERIGSRASEAAVDELRGQIENRGIRPAMAAPEDNEQLHGRIAEAGEIKETLSAMLESGLYGDGAPGLRRLHADVSAAAERLQREAVGRAEAESQRSAGGADPAADPNVIVASAKMRELLALAGRVARTKATVLLSGETGAGKEVVARALHAASKVKDGPFVAVHAGSIPTELIESELFGHTKGAFTDAKSDRLGRVQAAEGGTLFIDEIEAASPQLQVALLRLLENSEVQRVGDPKPTKVNVRVIAATNQDLAALVRAGKFREDLYYRLRVFPLRVPALRERPEDVIPLAHFFLKRARAELDTPARVFSEAATAALKAYRWPGNARELKHAVERAAIVAAGAAIVPEDLDLPDNNAATAPGEAPTREDELIKRHFLSVYESAGYNKRRTAELLGLSLKTVYNRLADYGLPVTDD